MRAGRRVASQTAFARPGTSFRGPEGNLMIGPPAARDLDRRPPGVIRCSRTIAPLQLTPSTFQLMPSPGSKFRAALEAEKPLQLAGAINAYAALLVRFAGHG